MTDEEIIEYIIESNINRNVKYRCLELLRRQIHKKVIRINGEECCECGQDVEYYINQKGEIVGYDRHCPQCDAFLDWSEIEAVSSFLEKIKRLEGE